MSEDRKSIVVTGVSTGIGFALTEVMIKEGYRVFGSVRKEADAAKLLQKFGSAFTPLLFDITDEAAVKKAAQEVSEALKGKTLSGLINNAGVAWPAPLLHQSIADFRRIIDANLLGTFIAVQAFLPLLGTDLKLKGDPGRILNITSVAGKYGAPFMGAYTASKHAVEGMSESLRRELIPYGIDVIIVGANSSTGPGSVRTPIWEKAQSMDVSAYKGTAYEASLGKFVDHMTQEGQTSSHSSEFMARAISRVFNGTSPWTRYAIVDKWLKNSLMLNLPTRWIDKAMANTFGLKPLSRK